MLLEYTSYVDRHNRPCCCPDREVPGDLDPPCFPSVRGLLYPRGHLPPPARPFLPSVPGLLSVQYHPYLPF